MAEPKNKLQYSPVNIETNFAAVENDVEKASEVTDGPGPKKNKLQYKPKGGPILDDYNSFEVGEIRNELGYDLSANVGAEGFRMARAENQGAGEQAMNMLGQIVVGEALGGTIEGFGYLLDFEGIYGKLAGHETEWGNWMTEFGAGIREDAQENMAIHQTKPGEFNMADSGWWFGNGVSVASTLSIMIPGLAVTRAVGMLGKIASRSARVMKQAAKMGKQAKWMTEGISQAVMSRHVENSLEGKGTFESAYADYQTRINPKTDELYTEVEARQLAAEAASSNYRMGWAMLGQDMLQYLAIGKVFNPRTMKMEAAIKKGKKLGKGQSPKIPQWARKTLNGAGVMGSEGLEEGYQYYISEKAKGLTDLRAGLINEEEYEQILSDSFNEEMATSSFWGAIGGGIFQAAGPGMQNAFKSKKRKEFEKNYATIQKNFLKNRGAAYAEFQKELDAADQADDPARREQVIGQMMMTMTEEAISLDRFDEHIESLNNMQQMSQEEKEAFAAEGVELNEELFKKYVPQAIDLSNKIRKRYLKFANKHDHVPAMAMARNEVNIDIFEASITQENAAIAKAKESPNYNKTSEPTRTIAEARAQIQALELANTILNANKSANEEGTKAKHTNESMATNQEQIDELNETIKSNKAKLKDRTKEEKAADKKYGIEVDQVNEDTSLSRAKIAMSDAHITTLRKENNLLKTKKYQRELREEALTSRIDAEVDASGDLDAQLFNTKVQLESMETEKDISKKKIDELKVKLAEKITKIEAMIAAKKAEEAVSKADQEILDEAAARGEASNPKSNVDREAEQNISDDHAEPMEVHAEQILSNTDSVAKAKEGRLETFQVTYAYASPTYKAWVNDGTTKIGTQSEYKLSDYIDARNKQAVKEFKALVAEGRVITESEITEDMIHTLPIAVEFGGNPENYTFLATRTGNNQKHFDKIREERLAILLALANNNKAVTIVGGSTSGQLQIDSAQKEGYIPENSILDLEQFKGDIDNIELVYSDKNGFLVDPETGGPYDGLSQRMLLRGENEEGLKMPYRGGLYAVVKTADGRLFPLKLNLKKNTVAQATVLADLLEATYASGKDGIDMKSSIGSIDNADLKKKIEDTFGPELEVIGGQEATILELINMFTYVSKGTTGLKSELYSSKGKLHFNGVVLQAGQAEQKEALIEFLTKTKRRQYSVDLETRFEGYREFMIEQRIINTNAETKGPLFKGGQGRQTQIYMEKIEGTTTPETIGEISTNGEVIINVKADDFSFLAPKQPTPSNNKPSSIYDKKMLDAELNYLEETFGREMADVYFQGIEALPEKNQKELDKILTDTKAVAEERIKDSQIPVSKQTFTVQNDGDETITVDVTTQLDGSRKVVQKLDDGSVAGSEKISKDNTLTDKDYVSKAYGDVKSTEDVDIKTVMNPKLESRMSDRQSAALESTQQSGGVVKMTGLHRVEAVSRGLDDIGTQHLDNISKELYDLLISVHPLGTEKYDLKRAFLTEVSEHKEANGMNAYKVIDVSILSGLDYYKKIEQFFNKSNLTHTTSKVASNEDSSMSSVVSSWLQTEEGSLDNQTAEESASKFALIYNKKNPVTDQDNRSVAQMIADNKKLSASQRRDNAGKVGEDLFNTIEQGMSVRDTILKEIKKVSSSLGGPKSTKAPIAEIVGSNNEQDASDAVFKTFGKYRFGIVEESGFGERMWIDSLSGEIVPENHVKKINAIRVGFGLPDMLDKTLNSGKNDVSSQDPKKLGDKSSLGVSTKKITKSEEEADTKDYNKKKCSGDDGPDINIII